MEELKFHFFWDGYLSQWNIAEFVHPIRNIKFNCAEQYMMYCKAMVFGDPETAIRILGTNSPREQKALGRQVSNFDAAFWNRCSRYFVYEGNLMKFQQNQHLKEYLINTGEDFLVEASPFDRIWGIGFNEEQALSNLSNWGSNWLGEVLMEVRDTLKQEK